MIQEKELGSYFDAQIRACQEKEAALLADGRSDEAVFEKIRANVFGIFQTIWNTGRGEDFFREKLEAIPRSWQAAYGKAEAHGDGAAMHVEALKLEAAREIKNRLEEWK